MAIRSEHRNDEVSRKHFQESLGRGGFIFFKPDPEDKAFSKRWTALSYAQKLEFTKNFSGEFLPKVFDLYDLIDKEDYVIDYVDHYEGDDKIPTIHVKFLSSITHDKMQEALLDAATVLKSIGGIEILDPYD